MGPKRRKKNSVKGCLVLIIGTVCVFIGIALFILATGQLTSTFTNHVHSGEVVYTLLTAQQPCIIVAFIIMYGILVLQYLPSQEDYDKQHPEQNMSPMLGQPQKPSKLGSKLAMNIVSAILLVAVIAVGAVSVTTHQAVSTEGISTYICGIKTSSYEWEDVNAYQVDCDDSKGLSVTFTMKDGKQFEILQASNSATEEFLMAYEGADSKPLAFAADLDERITGEFNIPRNVMHMDRALTFYERTPALLPFVKQITGYYDLNPDERETEHETSLTTAAG